MRLAVHEPAPAPSPAPVNNIPSAEIFKLHTGPVQMNILPDGKISGWPIVEDYGIKQLLTGEIAKPKNPDPTPSRDENVAPTRSANHRLHSPLLEQALEMAPVSTRSSRARIEWVRPALDISLILVMVAFSGVAVHWLVNVNLSPQISLKPVRKGTGSQSAKTATGKQTKDATVGDADSVAIGGSGSVLPKEVNVGGTVTSLPATADGVPATADLGNRAPETPKSLDIRAIAARSESKRTEETAPPAQISIEMGDTPGQTETRTFANTGGSSKKRGILFVAGKDTAAVPADGEKQQLAAKPTPQYTDATEVQLPKLEKPYPDKDVVNYHRLLAEYFTKHGKKEAEGTTQEDAPEPPSMAEWLQQGKPEF